MIARTWKGAVRREDGDDYAEYMRKTGMPGYTQTPGNLATLMLRRDVGDRCEFLMFTLWDSIEAVKAIFYPGDDAFLIGRDLTSSHWTVEEAVGLHAEG
jgi:heme-degrading monooxygenase HmoA